MRFFTCVLDTEGRDIPADVCRAYELLPRRRGLQFQWQSANHMALLTAWDDPYGDPLSAWREGDDWLAVGVVRLDNRPELARWAECAGGRMTDLELVRSVIAKHGTRFVSQFLGDFAFVAWNGRTRTAVAACDTFAVQKLYYAERNDALFVFSTRAEALALEERYDVQYLAELVSLHRVSPDLTVYDGVRTIPPASIAVLQHGRLNVQTYWRASDWAMEASWVTSEQHVIETCRELLAESIRRRINGDGGTWAQLSGGIDSSSIVSLTQWLAERGEISRGLAGTVTFVDHHDTGTDERQYSDTVINRWGVRNERIVDPPTWYDDHYAPPHTDQPRGDIHIYPRDSRLQAIVRSAGGRVLLTGVGGDELFTGNMLFFADWIARGRLGTAVREMARRAAIGRVSFWELAYRNAVLPLLPRALYSRLVHDQHGAPIQPWLEPATMRRHGIAPRAASVPAYGGRLGRHYHHAVVTSIGTLESPSHGGVIADSLDVRHPFLYRPLVEFALRLPPELRARPHTHRWVLREAMRGILPEAVRTRVGKPGTADVLSWSLRMQHARLAPLVRDPMLAELGIVNPARLCAAFDAASREPEPGPAFPLLFVTLGVEAWLQIRSGRWPCAGH